NVTTTSTTPGTATLSSTIDGTSKAFGIASVKGEEPSGNEPDNVLDYWIQKGKDKGWLSPSFSLLGNDLVTPSGPVGAAAAIAVNVGAPSADAHLLAGATLTSGAALSISATALYDSEAEADASSTDDGAGVALGVSVNVAVPSADATISGAASGPSVTLAATADGESHARSFGGIGLAAGTTYTSLEGTGAIAVNVAVASSHALVDVVGSMSATGP